MHKTVIHGRDPECIKVLMELHCSVSNPKILDVTYNKGKIWKGLPFPVTRMDIDSSLDVDIVGDFRQIPVEDKSYDVIVFDPPHLPSDIGSSSIWREQYNTGIFDDGRKKDNISALFEPFLLEAKRVLVKNGVVFAKLADIVHNHRYQWHQVDFVVAARSVGMTPCDMLIKCDPSAGKLISSKWKNMKHLRKSHCYWIVIRNSNRCERC